MELLRADYYKQLTEGYEANKQQIKDLRTAKALLIAEQKEYRRITGELKQAQQTISQLRENNRELKSKYKALLNQKMKEKQPAPRISNASEIIHSDKEEESEESDEEEQDEGEGEEGEGEGQPEEEHRDEERSEGKQAIIEGEPDPPYLDEAEPGLFTPNI